MKEMEFERAGEQRWKFSKTDRVHGEGSRPRGDRDRCVCVGGG